MKSIMKVFLVSLLAICYYDCAFSEDAWEIPYKLRIVPIPASDDNPSHVIASLRQNPTHLQICSGSFIRTDVILTTATCIYARNVKNIYAYALAIYNDKGGISVPAKRLVSHPYYQPQPSLADIGLVLLKENVTQATVLSLPMYLPFFKGHGNVYSWTLVGDDQKYQLTTQPAPLITNAKCTVIMREYIDVVYVCAESNVFHGSMDEGTPLTGSINNTKYVLGLYNKNAHNTDLPADKYEIIYQYVEWINFELNRTNDTGSINIMRENKA